MNVHDDLEIIERSLKTIDIVLKSNYKLLLTNTKEFKTQLDISSQDLIECNQKISFLLKGVNGEFNNRLQKLKEFADSLSHQLQIIFHIYSLKAITK